MVQVALNWKYIEWLPNETWKKQTLPKLEEVGLRINELKRSVYVIRLNGDYCMNIRKANLRLCTLAKVALASASISTKSG